MKGLRVNRAKVQTKTVHTHDARSPSPCHPLSMTHPTPQKESRHERLFFEPTALSPSPYRTRRNLIMKDELHVSVGPRGSLPLAPPFGGWFSTRLTVYFLQKLTRDRRQAHD